MLVVLEGSQDIQGYPSSLTCLPKHFHSCHGLQARTDTNRYTILAKVLGHSLLMKGLTTLVMSMSTHSHVFFHTARIIISL